MDRSKMVRRAVARWLAANLEPSKSANIDFLDLVDKFNDHSNSELVGLRISNGQLISYIEEIFKGVKFDKDSGRLHGVNWRKPRKIEFKPLPVKDPKETAMEIRLGEFLNDRNQDIKHGKVGFKTIDFANYRQALLMGGFYKVGHDMIDFKEAQAWLEKRDDLVESKDGLWYIRS